MFRSDDYGTTWTFSDWSYNTGPASITVNPKSPKEVYTYNNSGFGIIKSTTYGYGDWTTISSGLETAAAVPNLLIDPENVSRMYVGSNHAVGDPSVYRSDDTGYHWLQSDSGITTDQGVNF